MTNSGKTIWTRVSWRFHCASRMQLYTSASCFAIIMITSFTWTTLFCLVGQKLTYFLSISICWFYIDLTFDIAVIADDYDRSISEAIKITKYGIHLLILHSCSSFWLFLMCFHLSILHMANHVHLFALYSQHSIRFSLYQTETTIPRTYTQERSRSKTWSFNQW